MDQIKDAPPATKDYDPRWFIWTIVFLVAAGVGLTTYIVSSDNSLADADGVVVHHATTAATQTAQTRMVPTNSISR